VTAGDPGDTAVTTWRVAGKAFAMTWRRVFFLLLLGILIGLVVSFRH